SQRAQAKRRGAVRSALAMGPRRADPPSHPGRQPGSALRLHKIMTFVGARHCLALFRHAWLWFAGRRMRRPYEFEVIVRRDEACLALFRHTWLWFAGRRMRRPYEFGVIVRRGEALPRPLSTYVAVVCRATHA